MIHPSNAYQVFLCSGMILYKLILLDAATVGGHGVVASQSADAGDEECNRGRRRLRVSGLQAFNAR